MSDYCFFISCKIKIKQQIKTYYKAEQGNKMSQKEFISRQNGVPHEAEGVRRSRMLKPALWGPVHQSG